LDKRTGKTIEENPKEIKNGESALVIIQPRSPVCLETFKDMPPLGRFLLRNGSLTIAVGIIKEVEHSSDKFVKPNINTKNNKFFKK